MDEFSDREKKILKILGKRSMSLKKISDELFKDDKTLLDTEIAVGNSVRRIIIKCEHYKKDWTLEKTKVINRLQVKKVKR